MEMFGFGSSATIDIRINSSKTTNLKGEMLPVIAPDEDIAGSAEVVLNPRKKLDHNGITLELIGEIKCKGNNP